MIDMFLFQTQLNNKEDLLQKLQLERKAAEAAVATKKTLDEQRLAVSKHSIRTSISTIVLLS
jgi:hypothetical protein